jgi:serine/threonine protein kinase
MLMMNFRSENEKYVLKDIPETVFSHFNVSISPRLRQSPYMRLPADTILSRRTFAYEEANCQVLSMLWEDCNEENIPYTPFAEWQEVEDAGFKDLVSRMMNLGPTRRITASEALDHGWFAEVD